MSFNYRLLRFPPLAEGDEETYVIHEVYYNEDGSIKGYTVNPADVFGLSPEEAKESYEMLADAFEKEVIDVEELVKKWSKGR